MINWIDKNVNEIKYSEAFKSLFENKEVYKDEGDFYFSNQEKGIELIASECNEGLIVVSIHLMMESNDYLNEFLPFKICFNNSQKDVRKIYGVPNKFGGGNYDLHFGHINLWDKYFYEKYSIRFEYQQDGISIKLITIASKSVEVYFNSQMQ